MFSRLLGPESLLVISFAALILAGATALSLPMAHGARATPFVDALFTSTSAVCVTGLTTMDTARDFSRTGQAIILTLIQLGGLGIMTFAALIYSVFRGRMSLRSSAALQDTFFQGVLRGGLNNALWRIVLLTLVIESLGAGLIYAGMRSGPDPDAPFFHAMFLAISAYCNAGFSVYSDNVITLSSSHLVMWAIMALITLGGLGYTVLFETIARLRDALLSRRSGAVRWSLNSRVVGQVSLALVVVGAVAIALTGLGSEEMPLSERLFHSLFQSVSARTAGFNSVDLAVAPTVTLMVILPLMFIGGSPGSCAGGIKTTSFAVLVARGVARVRGSEEVFLLDRRVPFDVAQRAAMVFALAIAWNALGIFLLVVTEEVGTKMRMEHIIFEQISAFGTVGLSAGVTPQLSTFGKLWIIATMFLGRVGPLTLALAVVRQSRRPIYSYAEERVMVG